jgi:hypothetical protein
VGDVGDNVVNHKHQDMLRRRDGSGWRELAMDGGERFMRSLGQCGVGAIAEALVAVI